MRKRKIEIQKSKHSKDKSAQIDKQNSREHEIIKQDSIDKIQKNKRMFMIQDIDMDVLNMGNEEI